MALDNCQMCLNGFMNNSMPYLAKASNGARRLDVSEPMSAQSPVSRYHTDTQLKEFFNKIIISF